LSTLALFRDPPAQQHNRNWQKIVRFGYHIESKNFRSGAPPRRRYRLDLYRNSGYM
jgi:hypothetical protein